MLVPFTQWKVSSGIAPLLLTAPAQAIWFNESKVHAAACHGGDE